MKATAYYVTLTKDQTDELNLGGWDSNIGRRYLAAKAGKINIATRTLFRPAAILNRIDAEQVWTDLQNHNTPWAACRATDIECLTDSPRSMDVGDLVVWEDGRIERVASFGFEPAEGVTPGELRAS